MKFCIDAALACTFTKRSGGVRQGVRWGRKVVHEVRRFGTTTRELMALAAWLESLEVTHVAMEATGVDWNPVWHFGSRFDAHPGQCAARAQRTGPQERRE